MSRIDLLPCFYSIKNSKICLCLSCWDAGEFPLSYTPLECVEVYCELVDWKLLYLIKERGEGSYSISVEVQEQEYVSRTILENHYDFTDLGAR